MKNIEHNWVLDALQDRLLTDGECSTASEARQRAKDLHRSMLMVGS